MLWWNVRYRAHVCLWRYLVFRLSISEMVTSTFAFPWLGSESNHDAFAKVRPSERNQSGQAGSHRRTTFGQFVSLNLDAADFSFLFEINIYDLRRHVWSSKTLQPELQGLHSKGAYRSVAISSKVRVIDPPKGDGKASSAHSYIIDEEGEGGGEFGNDNADDRNMVLLQLRLCQSQAGARYYRSGRPRYRTHPFPQTQLPSILFHPR